MAELLASPRVKTAKDLETVFDVYNAVRRHRTMWLVQSSRMMGQLVEWQVDGIGKNLAYIEAEETGRLTMINDMDVANLCESAKLQLENKLDEVALKAKAAREPQEQ